MKSTHLLNQRLKLTTLFHDNDKIAIGDWVAVIYDDVWYPGNKFNVNHFHQIKIKFAQWVLLMI